MYELMAQGKKGKGLRDAMKAMDKRMARGKKKMQGGRKRKSRL